MKEAQYLDKHNILWKLKGDELIGKRSVYTNDLRACWIEDCEEKDIRSYWSGGKDADYKEVFK